MEKHVYYALAGVELVNGNAVPTDRKVLLSEVEAAFDLAHGRISKQKPEAARKAD